MNESMDEQTSDVLAGQVQPGALLTVSLVPGHSL